MIHADLTALFRRNQLVGHLLASRLFSTETGPSKQSVIVCLRNLFETMSELQGTMLYRAFVFLPI